MKLFNKVIGLACVAACLPMTFACIACDGSGDASVYSVSEEEWRLAFSKERFENVTMEQKVIGAGSGSFILEDGTTCHYTVNTTQTTKADLPNGIIFISGYSEYEYDKDVDPISHPARKDNYDRIYIKEGNIVSGYVFNEEGGWSYEGDGSDYFEFYEENMEAIAMAAVLYKSYKFDNDTYSYVLDAGGIKQTVKIENKWVVFVSSEGALLGVNSSSRYTDYGTTIIEIPDNLPPIE